MMNLDYFFTDEGYDDIWEIMKGDESVKRRIDFCTDFEGKDYEICESEEKSFFKGFYRQSLQKVQGALHRVTKGKHIYRAEYIDEDEQKDIEQYIEKNKNRVKIGAKIDDEFTIGRCWAWDRAKAIPYKKHGYPREEVVFIGQIDSTDDIDLEETIATNAIFGAKEKEIRLKEGATVNITDIYGSNI